MENRRRHRLVISGVIVVLMFAGLLQAGLVRSTHFVWVSDPTAFTVDAHWHQYDTHADLKVGGFIAYFYRWCWNVLGQPQDCSHKADVYAIYYPIIQGMQCVWVQPDEYLYTIDGLAPTTTYEFRMFVFVAKFHQTSSCVPPTLDFPPDIRGGDSNLCVVQLNCRATTLAGDPGPPPRGGSPHVTLYGNAGSWIKETNVLPQSESYVGPNPPDWNDAMQFVGEPNGTGGYYRIEIHEFQSAHNMFDRIGLRVVDYPAGISVAVDPNGQVHSYSATSAPISATNSVGASILPRISAMDGDRYTAGAGDWITADFGPVTSLPGPKQKIVFGSMDNIPSACNCWKESVPVQVQMSNGTWTTAATLYPRLDNRVQVVDLTGQFLPGGNAIVRLLLGGHHQIDWLALDASSDAVLITSIVLPSQLNYSDGTPSAISLIQNDDGAYLTLDPGAFIFLGFPVPAQMAAQRALFLDVNGYYHVP